MTRGGGHGEGGHGGREEQGEGINLRRGQAECTRAIYLRAFTLYTIRKFI